MEAYLKKLCFEYQVEEKEVKELLARMERVSCIHLLPGRERTKPSDSCPKVMLYCAIIQVSILSKH